MKELQNKSLTFNLIVVLAISMTSFTTFFLLFGSILIEKNIESTKQLQQKWVESYSKTFLEDLSLGRSHNVERRLNQLVRDGICESIKLKFSDQEINTIEQVQPEEALVYIDKIFDRVLNTKKYTKIIFDLKDGYGSIWGNIELNISKKVSVEPLKRNLIHFLLYYIAFNFIAIALALFLFKNIEESLAELKNTILSKVNSKKIEHSQNEVQTIKFAFEEYERKIQSSEKQLMAQSKSIAMAELAAQVAHDIRSPLAALTSIEKDLTVLPEEVRLLMRNAISRINDIAAQLLAKRRDLVATSNENEGQVTNAEPVLPRLAVPLVEDLVSEKRIQYRTHTEVSISTKINENSYNSFISVQSSEFLRALSNLINNAVEATKHSGVVTVSIQSIRNQIEIQITDNGIGISAEHLKLIGTKGKTFGKESGSGLGLYHAMTVVSQWGGTVSINSDVGKGTCVTILLPNAEPPKWFVPQLEINQDTLVVVLDDDSSIHQVWKRKFESSVNNNLSIKLQHHLSPEELVIWHQNVTELPKNILYLVDYEFLGFSENGLDIIKRLSIENSSILVTSRYDDAAVLSRCSHMGVRLIPKQMAAFTPISILNHKNTVELEYSAILIDDDDLIHTLWKISAKNHNKKILSFKSVNDFLNASKQLNKQTSVYIDSNLGPGLNGEVLAKEIYDAGFKHIHLTTGFPAEMVQSTPWIKSIIGKSPPWESGLG